MTALTSARWRAPRIPRVIATTIVALLALGTASAATAAPTAVEPTPQPSPSSTPPSGTADDVSAELNNFGPFVVAADQAVAATLTLTNDSVLPVTPASAFLSITQQPLSTREELAAFFDNPATAPKRVLNVAAAGVADVDDEGESLDTGTLRPRSATSVRVTASAKDLALPAGTSGVYGVTTSFKVGNSTVFVDSMALTWQGEQIPNLPVTAVATVAGQPSDAAALLKAADIDGVTMLVDPTSLASPMSLDELDGHESFMLPASNPDVTSLAHAGDSGLIDFALTESRSRVWTNLAGGPWISLSAIADQSVMEWSAAAGAQATLLSTVDARSPGATLVGVADDGQAPLVVPDAGLSDLVATFRPTDPAGPSRIVAESALIAASPDNAGAVVVSPGLEWVVTGDGPSANLAALMSAPWVTPQTLAQTIADAPVTKATLPAADGVKADVPVDKVVALADRLTPLGKLAATANSPASIMSPGGLTLLGGVSSATRGDPDLQVVAFENAIAGADATLDAVAIVSNSDVNLIASSGEVPITVRNNLAVESTVTVVMRSTSPNLQVRDRPVITVPAGGEQIAMVPVEAVSSANVTLSVWLDNPQGDSISPAQNFTMRVRADWGSAATAVFTGLLVLVLIGGIIRTIRRGRKDTRTGPGAPAEGAKIIDGEVHD